MKAYNVRKSNSVFEPEYDTICRIVCDAQGNVIACHEIQAGFYGMDDMPAPGWTVHQLLAWLSRDGTGNHPEHYYEIANEGDDYYTSFFDMSDLVEFLGARR